jgi:hypothetical protein
VVKKETLKVTDFAKDENILFNTISSSGTDIQICLLINEIFNIKLSLTDDLIVKIKDQSVNFSKYLFENDHEGEKFILYKNRNQEGMFLLPEFKKIDFIFLIISEINAANYSNKFSKLRKNSEISAIFKIDPITVKNFSRLNI